MYIHTPLSEQFISSLSRLRPVICHDDGLPTAIMPPRLLLSVALSLPLTSLDDAVPVASLLGLPHPSPLSLEPAALFPYPDKRETQHLSSGIYLTPIDRFFA